VVVVPDVVAAGSVVVVVMLVASVVVSAVVVVDVGSLAVVVSVKVVVCGDDVVGGRLVLTPATLRWGCVVVEVVEDERVVERGSVAEETASVVLLRAAGCGRGPAGAECGAGAVPSRVRSPAAAPPAAATVAAARMSATILMVESFPPRHRPCIAAEESSAPRPTVSP
jgi:hypothetical protein